MKEKILDQAIHKDARSAVIFPKTAPDDIKSAPDSFNKVLFENCTTKLKLMDWHSKEVMTNQINP